MSRRQKHPLRPLTDTETTTLEQVARAQSEPASHVARAIALLAVAAGATYEAAAQRCGRRCGDTVAVWVARFNREGLAALRPNYRGGRPPTYGAIERDRILAEVKREPDRQRDGTATWSISTLQRALRQAPDGLPHVSTMTLWTILRQAGLSWQQTRSWCSTGSAIRKRKAGVVTVTDPDAESKKS